MQSTVSYKGYNMQVLKKFSELVQVDEEIQKEIMAIYNSVPKDASKAFPGADVITIADILGGDVYIVETAADLASVYISADEPTSILDAAGIFDAAHMLPSMSWYLLMLAGNDDGGNVYFVPKAIADFFPNIINSVLASNEGTLAIPETSYADAIPVMSYRGDLRRVYRISPITGLLDSRLMPLSLLQVQQMQHGRGMQFLTSAEYIFYLAGCSMKEIKYLFAYPE
jgi:hypothetical protein